MEAIFQGKPTAEWLTALEAANIPCAPATFPEEMFGDPHVVANDLIPTVDHAVVGPVRMPRHPVTLSETPPVEPQPPPALGQHSEAVMLELGYSADEVQALFDAGVLWTRDLRLKRDQ